MTAAAVAQAVYRRSGAAAAAAAVAAVAPVAEISTAAVEIALAAVGPAAPAEASSHPYRVLLLYASEHVDTPVQSHAHTPSPRLSLVVASSVWLVGRQLGARREDS